MTQDSIYEEDSLSSRVGVAGIMYGAEAGTGPGVRADSSGERSAESSGPLPQLLIGRALSTLFFLPALQAQRATNTTVQYTVGLVMPSRRDSVGGTIQMPGLSSRQ